MSLQEPLITVPPPSGRKAMMLSDICLSHTSGRRAACAAGLLDGAYWLIGPGLAGLAQGCRCGLPLQAWAGAYRGGHSPAYSLLAFNLAYLTIRLQYVRWTELLPVTTLVSRLTVSKRLTD